MKLDDLPTPEYEGTVAPEELHVDGENPNEQDDETFGLLCDRLREHGWLGGPIVTDTGGLIADGEHRWRAAQEIGLEEVPVRQYDIDDATRRLWRQELNKITGEHDPKRDALEYDQLLEAGLTEEVEVLTSVADEDLDDLLEEIRVDNSVRPTYEYDVSHEVHFEDCVAGIADRVDTDAVDVVVTDPPYGVDIDLSDSMGRKQTVQHAGTVAADEDAEAALELWDAALAEIDRALASDGHLYCFASWKTVDLFKQSLEARGFEIGNILVWEKTDANHLTQFGVGGSARYAYKHEFCLFAFRDDPRPIEGHPNDVFEITEPRFGDEASGDLQHPTQKPVELLRELIVNSTDPEDVVLDPFIGSGSTAVAAIQADRDYIGFEVDEEHYREVIERRIGEAKRQREASVQTGVASIGGAE